MGRFLLLLVFVCFCLLSLYDCLLLFVVLLFLFWFFVGFYFIYFFIILNFKSCLVAVCALILKLLKNELKKCIYLNKLQHDNKDEDVCACVCVCVDILPLFNSNFRQFLKQVKT